MRRLTATTSPAAKPAPENTDRARAHGQPARPAARRSRPRGADRGPEIQEGWLAYGTLVSVSRRLRLDGEPR
jgi:hypothetical protein